MSKPQSLAMESLYLYGRASWEHRRNALLALTNPLGGILTGVAVPFYASKTLGSITAHNGQFGKQMGILVVVAIAGLLASRVGFINLMVLQAKTMRDLNGVVFNRLMHRSVGFHTDQISGKLVSDALDFISSYGMLITSLFNLGISFAGVLIVGLAIVALNSWQLGLFLFIAVCITVLWAYAESRTRGHLRNIRLVATKNVTAHLSDSIVNASTVKTFAMEQHEISKNQRLNDRLFGLRIKDWSRSGRSGNNRMAFLLVMLIGLLWLLNRLATSDPTVVATGIFAFTYTFTLMIRLFDINTLTRQVEEAFLQASPITEILQEEIEVQDIRGATNLKVASGAIEFDNVEFTYTDEKNNQEIFEDLYVSIEPGEKIGLVGPSGGGKSTFTKLLLRFADIQSGEIRVDAQNIAQVTQRSLREHIAYVPQEALLFHRSIKENILYGKPSATNVELRRAAKLAHASEFIDALPRGYDTVVGERGIKLSGGQRQRIVIARAILKNAPILVLDEATSALDSESEKLIQAALRELMQDKTTIVIAHRLSTIQQMDRIIVMDSGKIIEQGSHKSLLTKKGLYARLWAHQSGGFIAEDNN